MKIVFFFISLCLLIGVASASKRSDPQRGYIVDNEIEKDRTWPDGAIVHVSKTGKFYRLINGAFVEIAVIDTTLGTLAGSYPRDAIITASGQVSIVPRIVFTSKVTSYSDFSALLTAIDTTSVRLVVDRWIPITANRTVDTNIHMDFVRGGGFTVSATKTLTINGSFTAGLGQIFSGSGTVYFGNKSVNVDYPQWFGARLSSSDNATAFQAAISAFHNISGHTTVTDSIWRIGSGLTLPTSDFILDGNGADQSRIKYTGSGYVDVITVGDSVTQTVNVKIRNICIIGGEFQNGKARWCIYAHWFNNGCEITGVQVRDAVGLIRIREGFHSNISDVYGTSTTPNLANFGGTQPQWEEVHGSDRAPLMIMRANAANINNVAIYRVGSEVSGGVTPYANVIITGQGVNVRALSQEGCGTYTNGSTFNLRAKYGKVLGNKTDGNGFIGTVSGDYVEDCDWTTAGVYTEERTHAIIDGPFWYKARCDGDLFYNAGAGDLNVMGGDIYGGASYSLYHSLSSAGALATGSNVNFKNTSVLSGLRVTDAGYSGVSNNVFDPAGTSYHLGIIDRDREPSGDRGYNYERRETPSVIQGYAVTNSSDGSGDYVIISSGWFKDERGEFVSNRHPASDNTPAWQKLRPDSASKYYRIFVGKAGQPYLIQYAAAQTTTPYGNWISEFQTDGSTHVTALTANPRLSYYGKYFPNTPNNLEIALDTTPSTGYWLKGDMVVNTSPSAGNTAKWICTTAGSPGTWGQMKVGANGTVTTVSVVTANGVSGSVATATTTPAITLTLGDITPSSVTATNEVKSASGNRTGNDTVGGIFRVGSTFIVPASGLGTNRIPFLNGSSNIATTSSLAWDGTTITLNAPIKQTNLLISNAAPTISSGFGTSPSVSSNNGTAAFRVNVGTGGTASSGVIGLPTAATGWNCWCNDITTNSTTVTQCKQTASTTTTATIGEFTDIAGAAAWVASDILAVSCFAY